MWVFILGCFFLAGCNPFAAFKPTSDELQGASWAPDPVDPSRKKEPKKQLFCYRTLGEPMCYSHELSERERNRLVGKTPEQKEKEPAKTSFSSWIPYPFR